MKEKEKKRERKKREKKREKRKEERKERKREKLREQKRKRCPRSICNKFSKRNTKYIYWQKSQKTQKFQSLFHVH